MTIQNLKLVSNNIPFIFKTNKTPTGMKITVKVPNQKAAKELIFLTLLSSDRLTQYYLNLLWWCILVEARPFSWLQSTFTKCT